MCPQTLYMALLTLYENNLRGLHWKLAGPNFNKDHLRFGDYYDQLGTFLDETAEMMITMGIPPVSVMMIHEILSGDDVNAISIDMSRDYTGEAANTAAQQMFTQLYEKAAALAKDDSLPVDVQDVYMAHAKYYRIECLYKLQRTLANQTGEPNPADNPAPAEEPPVEGDNNE